jgi:hypothetical protein
MMNIEQLQIAAPSIFAESPVDAVTKSYTFIPTTKLLTDFAKLGWNVERAVQQNSHTDSVHTKHKVVLRSPQFPAFNGNFPELIMVNSHNRTSAFTFMIGLMRLVCTNGLVVLDKEFESLRVRHIHYDFKDIEALTRGLVERMPKIMGAVNHLSQVTITREQQQEFAIKAIAARFQEYRDGILINDKAIIEAVDINKFLSPIRQEDAGDSVWATFNRIQERLTKGGFKRISTKDGISRRVREITNIKLDIDVNRELWAMANEYAMR